MLFFSVPTCTSDNWGKWDSKTHFNAGWQLEQMAVQPRVPVLLALAIPAILSEDCIAAQIPAILPTVPLPK
jgi:hypothetical protein